jgi:hypothetical protein
MLFNEIPWRAPVKICLQCGLERTFSTVFGALDFLENEWPLRHGQRYDRAISKCRGALRRAVPAEVAREAFIAACLEASLPAVVGAKASRTQPPPNVAVSS